MNNFKLVNADTDSIMVCKPNGSSFSEQEKTELLSSLNEQFPEKISFEDDGYFESVIVLKAKNYILWDGNKLKIKGNGIKDPKREPALRLFMDEIIQVMLNDTNNYVEIYNKYAKEILNVNDIKRWQTKKTISEAVLNPGRTNEQKILDAIKDTEYVEGDRAYFYYTAEKDLKLIEHYDGSYSKEKYLEKLYKTALIFSSVVDKSIFINYSLKRSQKLLGSL